MDIYCRKCGEPWDAYLDMEPVEKKRFKRGDGCPCCNFGETAPKKKPFRSQLADVAADLMGDDIDGIASMMDDAEHMIGEEFWDD